MKMLRIAATAAFWMFSGAMVASLVAGFMLTAPARSAELPADPADREDIDAEPTAD